MGECRTDAFKYFKTFCSIGGWVGLVAPTEPLTAEPLTAEPFTTVPLTTEPLTGAQPVPAHFLQGQAGFSAGVADRWPSHVDEEEDAAWLVPHRQSPAAPNSQL